MIHCKRCGLCCHYYFKGKLKKCKFLIEHKNGLTSCRNYRSRLGRLLDFDERTFRRIVCVERKNAPYNYPGCPYNEEDWPMCPIYENEIDKEILLQEVYTFKELCEQLSGVSIIPERLKESIRLVNQKRRLMQQINEFRKQDNPPISGLDALLIAQVSLNQDIHTFKNLYKHFGVIKPNFKIEQTNHEFAF